MLDGEPVEGRIKVYFHFAPPTQHQLEQHSDVFEMVVVHEENIDLEDSKIRMTLDEGDIARQATKDLAGIMEQTRCGCCWWNNRFIQTDHTWTSRKTSVGYQRWDSP